MCNYRDLAGYFELIMIIRFFCFVVVFLGIVFEEFIKKDFILGVGFVV